MLNHKNKLIKRLIEQDKQRFQRLYRLIAQGVKIVDPLTTHIDKDVRIGRGSVVYPLTVIEGNVSIGRNCEIGPFSRVRSGTRLKDNVHIGNFVEIVRSEIGEDTKAKHLTYLGDVKIEDKVNVGAGTIVANYDGKHKHKTRIKQRAFIGSGSILIAPVKIGRNAITGAGAVVTKGKDVPDGAVAVGMPARVVKSQSHTSHVTSDRKRL